MVRIRALSIVLALSLLALPLAAAPESRATRPSGRPDIKLDRLDFPSDVPGARFFEKRLRTLLKREARRADWGAGKGSKIEYRFSVAELTLERQGDVLRVRCTAVGKLPGGKSAKSNLSFGGDPNQRNRVVERVLEIVARGVITRLAELERVRRGDLGQSRVRVRPPPSSD